MAQDWKIVVTRQIPEAGLNLLRDKGVVTVWEDELPPSAEQLDTLLGDADGALTLLTDRIDAAVLDRHPNLKVVSNFAVGYDNIDPNAATERGVIVCNTPDVLTAATADHTWALLMAAARRIPEWVLRIRGSHWEEARRATRDDSFRVNAFLVCQAMATAGQPGTRMALPAPRGLIATADLHIEDKCRSLPNARRHVDTFAVIPPPSLR